MNDRLAAALSDRYTIERELGVGGMATVYLAEDVKHKRRVALKVLKPELAAVLGAERFVQEITTTAALQHPHILPLFDSGEADGFLYYVMPFIDGETLRAKLNRETQLGVDDAVKITTEVADALQYAHEHGVIHRDIKPENILLANGRPMVADFGIALALSAAAGGRMTETGLSLGTPHYMSPEQATAEKDITARSDVYSLASVCYEMIAGQPPHLGGSAQQIIMKIIAEPVERVTRYRKSAPDNIAAALSKALEKLPADRFESAKAFADALVNPGFTVATRSAEHGTTRAIRARTVPVLSAALACTLVVALWGWLRTGPTAAKSVGWVTELTLTDSLTLGDEDALIPSLSADGSALVFVAGSGRSTGVYLRRADDKRITRIEGTNGAIFCAISPDGESVAFNTGGKLYVIPTAGGERRPLDVPIRASLPFSWLDNEHVLHDVEDGIWSIPVSGTPATRLTTIDTVAGEALHLGSTPLPGGGIVYSVIPRGNLDADAMRIQAVDGRGGKVVDVAKGAFAAFASPDHLLIRKANGTIVAAPFNPKTLRVTGPEIVIVNGLQVATFNGEGYFAASASGAMVYLENPFMGTREVVAVSRDGSATPLVPGWTANIKSLSLTTDGQRLAVEHYTPSALELAIRDLQTGATGRVRMAGAQLRNPHWNADGTSLYFAAYGSGATGMYSVPARGGSEPQLIVSSNEQGTVDWPTPTADGQAVYFTLGGDTYRWMVGDSADQIVRLEETREAELRATPSPNGRWLAYISADQNRFPLVVRSTDSARSQLYVVSDRGTAGNIRWSHDGSELFFIDRDTMRVVRVNTGDVFSTSTMQSLFPTGRMSLEFDVAADGRFIMSRLLTRLEYPPRLIFLDDWKARLPR